MKTRYKKILSLILVAVMVTSLCAVYVQAKDSAADPSEAVAELLSPNTCKPPGDSHGNPSGGNPDDPSGENPDNPSGGNPGNPSGENPGNPSGGNPGNPSGENPDNPSGENPGNPSGENPGNPSGENPGNPSGENPDNPSGGNPGNPSGENPGNPSGENPDNPSGGNPDDPSGGNPDNPSGDPFSDPLCCPPSNCELTVTKTFCGLSEDEIASLSDFLITVTDGNGHNYELELEDASENDATYTWDLTDIYCGTYTVYESNYELADSVMPSYVYTLPCPFSAGSSGDGDSVENVYVSSFAAAQVDFTNTYEHDEPQPAEPIGFYININGEILDHAGDVDSRPVADFSDAVCTDSVLFTGPVLESGYYSKTSDESGDETDDANVRSEFEEGGYFELTNGFPTDEAVFTILNTPITTYQGNVIDWDNFDSSHYYIVWYVVKGQSDAWHVDGVISEKATYSVIYYDNVDGADISVPETQTKIEGIDLTLSSETPGYEGHVFTGWKTEPDGGDSFSPGGAYTANAPLALYAQWTVAEEDTYSVIYFGNGGKTSGGSTSVPKTCYANSGYVVLSNSDIGFSWTGHSFIGWTTTSGGSDYVDSGTQCEAPDEAAEVYYYAQWSGSDPIIIDPVYPNIDPPPLPSPSPSESPSEPPADIPEDTPPLEPSPDIIPEDEVPEADAPVTPPADIPVSNDYPQTGDDSASIPLMAVLAALSAAGLGALGIGLVFRNKKKKSGK